MKRVSVMGVQVIRTFVGEGGKRFEFEVEIAEGAGSVVLWVQAQVASGNTADFSLEAGGEAFAWEQLAGETLEGNNRRYRGGVWAAGAAPAGASRIEIVCGRAASVMAFVGLVEAPKGVEARREVSVVVRDLAAGETHEVRYVRPGELVMLEDGGGIDWERTRFVAHGFVIEE